MTQSMTTPAKRVRLADIASMANVSQMTVSKVLNPRKANVRVSKEVAENIRKIAAKLNYRPNLAARQLAGSRSKLIGAIIDTHSPLIVSDALAAIESYTNQRGYHLLVGCIHDQYKRIEAYAEDFLDRRAEGVICMSHTYPEFGHKIPELFAPFPNSIFLEPSLSDQPINYVAVNEYTIGQLATEHLLNLGHQRIAFMLSPVKTKTFETRVQAYRDSHAKAGIRVVEELLWRKNPWPMTGLPMTCEALRPVLELKPDALIVGSDHDAIWILHALLTMNIRVPQDIALMSCYAWPIGRSFRPSITTIDLHLTDLAATAIRLLIDDIENPPPPDRPHHAVIVEPYLIPGKSCGE